MSSVIDPSTRVFKKNSKADNLITVVGIGSAILFGLTIILAIISIFVGKPLQWLVVIMGLLWAVGAPAWFWYEYFFLYRIDGLPGTLELYKHGQQVSIAIWAGLAVSLGALASSDIFKSPAAQTQPSVTCAEAQHPPPNRASAPIPK